MTEPRQSAEELFGEALELPPEGRSAFLDRVCGHESGNFAACSNSFC